MECRRRKQKCDEIKPSCTKCLKKGICCQYRKAYFCQNETNNVANEKERNKASAYYSDKQCKVKHYSSNRIEDLNMDNDPIEQIHFNQLNTSKNSPSMCEPLPLDFDLTLDVCLDLDLEYKALTVLSTSENMKDYFNKYNYCYPILRSLAYSNKCVLFTFTGWLLSINENSEADKFLNHSLKLFDSSKSIGIGFNDDLVGIIVSQTCYCLFSSSRGDYNSWRLMFERTYNLLEQLGIDEAIERLQDNTAICWVLGWFFYQDIFKVGNFFNKNVSGPFFSKTIHQKFINQRSSHENVKIGPISKSCSNLYIIMGEVKTLYDLYIVKQKDLNNLKKKILNILLDGKEHGWNLDDYKKYDEMRTHFYNWFRMKVQVLEEKLEKTEINTEYREYSLEQQEKLLVFHSITKLALKIFLRIKILGLSVSALEIKTYNLEILKGIEKLITWNLNTYILFPFLIVGTCVCEELDKIMFTTVYEELKVYLKSGNLSKIWETIQQVWGYREKNGINNRETCNDIKEFDVCIF